LIEKPNDAFDDAFDAFDGVELSTIKLDKNDSDTSQIMSFEQSSSLSTFKKKNYSNFVN